MTDNLFKKAIAEYSRKGSSQTSRKTGNTAKTNTTTTNTPTLVHSKLASRVIASAAAKATPPKQPPITPRKRSQLILPASAILAVVPKKVDPQSVAEASRRRQSTKKPGRPANGKRSNQDWIARNIYIRREVDFDVEAELIQLRRQGIAIDKSELIDTLLSGWLNWRFGGDIIPHIATISPRSTLRVRRPRNLP